jgi:hypothetical protein
MNYYTNDITKLDNDEVFVFGANLQGFHGAGSAGFATFGEHGNVWRKHNYDQWPKGKKGRWNVKGKIGPQIGIEGKSYGLPTVTKAGAKRSLKIDFHPLYECCNRNPLWRFYFAQTASPGLNGWSPTEIVKFAKTAGAIPENLLWHISLKPYLEQP